MVVQVKATNHYSGAGVSITTVKIQYQSMILFSFLA